MNKEQYDRLYLELCKVIDDDLFIASLHGFETPTTRARRSVNKLLEILARHGIKIESGSHEETDSNTNDQP